MNLPRVTEVIKEAGLIDTTWMTSEGAERGTFVHTACTYWDEGDLNEETLDPALRGYVQAWIRYREESDVKTWEWIECPQQDALGLYRGTPDRICVSEPKTLLDIKTGQYHASHRVQTAAYVGMLADGFAYRRMCVYLSNDGRYSVREFPKKEYADDLKAFHAALSIWYYKRRYNILKENE